MILLSFMKLPEHTVPSADMAQMPILLAFSLMGSKPHGAAQLGSEKMSSFVASGPRQAETKVLREIVSTSIKFTELPAN